MFTASFMALTGCVLVLSMLAGIASYLQGQREGKFSASFINLAGEVTTAVISGLTVLFGGNWQQYPESLTCLCALVAAGMGKEWTALLTQALRNKLNPTKANPND